MLTEETKSTICTFSSVVQGIAALLLITQWINQKRRAERFGVAMGKYKHQFALILLIVGCMATAAGSLWFRRVSAAPATRITLPPPQNQGTASITPNGQTPSSETSSPPKPKHQKSPIATQQVVKQKGHDNQQTVNQGSITQNNTGGCNQQVVGGNNNSNICGEFPFSISNAQEDNLAAHLKGYTPPSNAAVLILAEPDLRDAATRLQTVLVNAGISATTSEAMMVGGCEGPGMSGLTISCVVPGNRDLADELNRALFESGITKTSQNLTVLPWNNQRLVILLKK